MKRRAALMGTALGVGAIILGVGQLPSTRTDERPNVIVLTSDDMSRSDLGAYGNTFIDTPNLDRLASESMKFDNFYAAPLCSPTRASFETGLHSVKVGITDHLPGYLWPYTPLYAPINREPYLPQEFDTIAEFFSEAGYKTAQFGKWHLEAYDELWETSNALAHGYEEFEFSGLINRVLRRLTGKSRFHRWIEANGYGDAANKSVHLTEYHAEIAADFIRESKTEPFFLVVSINDPHAPYLAKEDLIEKYSARQQSDAQETIDPVYAAMIEDVDAGIGIMLQAVAESVIEDDTIVVFFSDNGGVEIPFWDRDRPAQVTSNAPFRGQKGTLFEGGVRVPFMARWPDHIPVSVTNEVAWVADLLPTFATFAGLDVEDHSFDGMDISDVLTNKGSAPDRALYFHLPHYHNSPPSSAILRDQHKLIVDFESGETLLFNLDEDPEEKMDLSDQLPEVSLALYSELEQWWEEAGAVIPQTNPEYDPARAGEYVNVVR